MSWEDLDEDEAGDIEAMYNSEGYEKAVKDFIYLVKNIRRLDKQSKGELTFEDGWNSALDTVSLDIKELISEKFSEEDLRKFLNNLLNI